MLIATQQLPVPTRRKGKFAEKKLIKLLKSSGAGQHALISTPSDFRHNITVQPEHTSPYRLQCSPSSPESPPSSPSVLRLRAYARNYLYLLLTFSQLINWLLILILIVFFFISFPLFLFSPPF